MGSYRVLCDKSLKRSSGAIYSKYLKYKRYSDFHKEAEWLYSTSDVPVNCPECLKLRIEHHEKVILSLKARL